MPSLLEKEGAVIDYDTLLIAISDRLKGKYFAQADLEDLLAEGYDTFYFKKDGDILVKTDEDDQESCFKLLETRKTMAGGKILCLSFSRRVGGPWLGCFAGASDYLFYRFTSAGSERNKDSRISRPPNMNRNISLGSVPDSTENLKRIFQALLYEEKWNHDGSYTNLKGYLKQLRLKIEEDIKEGETDCFVFNATRTLVLFNSRLLDIYGNYLHLLCDYQNSTLSNTRPVGSNAELRMAKFDIGKLDIQPTRFHKDFNDLAFVAEEEDFDFTDTHSLNHIINERRLRLPESMQSKSPIEIVSCLRNSVFHAVRMSKTDHRFVVPMYSSGKGSIQFLVPFYETFFRGAIPTNALVVDNRGGTWSIRTILSIQQAYINARLIGNPGAQWIETANAGLSK